MIRHNGGSISGVKKKKIKVEAQYGSATGPEKRPWQDGCAPCVTEVTKNIFKTCRCEKLKEEDNAGVLEFNFTSVLLCLMF